MNETHKRVVEEGYDRMAESYLGSKDPEDPTTLAALEELAQGLPAGAAVLDLGCGAGVPVTRWLADHGFAVTGVDFSARQLELARRLVPAANFLRADMTDLDFPPESFDAVVAFYSIIHVPRAEHPALLEDVRRWLRPGGAFLATWALGAWEGEEEDWEGWGAPMRWSHYGEEANLRMLREPGFEVVSAEARTGKGTGDLEETWLWVFARRGG
ncbi:MAG TPA: class I SAM-dependent methyltransferase [Rubrobacteraceae bacterium]|nr:class I SAM-dependent methyltransferase [Rubrobacteraceae bacterium]